MASIAGLLIALAACSGNSNSDQPSALDRPADIGSPTVAATPESVSAQDAAKVSGVVDALRSRDLSKIRPFVGFRKIACVAYASDVGAPKCQGNEKDGEQIDAFYFASCEGGYVRPPDVDEPLQVLTQTDVYGAYRLPKKDGSPYEYSIVLVDRASVRAGSAWETIIDNGQMIGLLFSCTLSPEDLVAARHYTSVVVAPR
jgi:hypothetical protein